MLKSSVSILYMCKKRGREFPTSSYVLIVKSIVKISSEQLA